MVERTTKFRRYMETKVYGYPLFFNVPIKGIGVWDTVGSLGIPVIKGMFLDWLKKIGRWDVNSKYGFHNVALGLGVENAFHAIALDEQRYAYRPSMWYREDFVEQIERVDPTNGEHVRRHALQNTAAEPNIMQVWFPGVHIDIGGGTKSGRYPEFSDMTLLWMMDQFNTRGVLQFKREMVDEIITAAKNRRPKQDTWMGKIKKFFTGMVSSASVATKTAKGETDRLLSAEIGKGTLGTGLAGLVPRDPGRWTNFDTGDLEELKQLAQFESGFPTREEYIHIVVRKRQEAGVPLPASLSGYTFDPERNQWHCGRKNGSPAVVLDEYQANPGTFEIRLYDHRKKNENGHFLEYKKPAGPSTQLGPEEVGYEDQHS